jgi:hypothetical protein
MSERDLIGKRGEAIVCACLTDFGVRNLPYFDPHPLGEKCPTFDYLVELVKAGDVPAYFLVQVKATRRGYSKRSAALKTAVTADDVRKMARCPIPAYLIGVDEPADKAFIVSVHQAQAQSISAIPTTFPLDEQNRKLLWHEVRGYWRGSRVGVRWTSVFAF